MELEEAMEDNFEVELAYLYISLSYIELMLFTLILKNILRFM